MEPSIPHALRHAATVPALALVAGALACGAPGGGGDEDASRSATEGAGGGAFRYIPEGSPVDMGLAGFAKVTCSAVFVSGRDPEEAVKNSGYFLVPEDRLDEVTGPFIDRDKGLVRMVHGDTLERSARYLGDQGCVLLPEGRDEPFYEPVAVVSALPPAESTPWPMGDVLPDEPPSHGVDVAGVREAVDLAFSDTAGLTQAFLVVHRGRIVGERYAPGVDKDTQLESWSMGKSLTATMVGRLIQQGAFDLHDPAPVPLWHEDPDDPRRAIRVSHLLNMSSGLHFIAPRDPDYGPDSPYPDHMKVYTTPVDVFRFSIDRPLQFPPGTEGRYRNSDPLTLGYIVRETVRARGEEYLTFAQREIFDRIGIRRQVMETDPYGNFVLTGFDYGTARNWARLAMLYLQDGVWNDERLLPEGFADFASTPAPAWKEPVYGGLFWINGDGAWNLPEDAYYMAGGGGQRTFLVPSHDLVVVRLGHFRGEPAGMPILNRALARLMDAVPPAH